MAALADLLNSAPEPEEKPAAPPGASLTEPVMVLSETAIEPPVEAPLPGPPPSVPPPTSAVTEPPPSPMAAVAPSVLPPPAPLGAGHAPPTPEVGPMELTRAMPTSPKQAAPAEGSLTPEVGPIYSRAASPKRVSEVPPTPDFVPAAAEAVKQLRRRASQNKSYAEPSIFEFAAEEAPYAEADAGAEPRRKRATRPPPAEARQPKRGVSAGCAKCHALRDDSEVRVSPSATVGGCVSV